MSDTSESIPDDLDLMLRIDGACGFNHTIIDTDGTVYGFAAHTLPTFLQVPPPADGLIEVLGGDQLMFKVSTMAEAKAYLYGVLMVFCGGDFGAIVRRMAELDDASPYETSVELHKLGWCPIWNSR